jgi:hypothetical protein
MTRMVTRAPAQAHQSMRSSAARLRRVQSTIAPKPATTIPHSSVVSSAPGATSISAIASAASIRPAIAWRPPHPGRGSARDIPERSLTPHIEAPAPTCHLPSQACVKIGAGSIKKP